MTTPRIDPLTIATDGDVPLPNPLPGGAERLLLENSGCYAIREEENETIHVFAKDGSELYALSSKVIAYESRPLFLTLQIYLMGHNNGRASMQQEVRTKLEKIADLMKVCL